jgi:antitoxin component HigA of HigAB toxin-antitoxin module
MVRGIMITEIKDELDYMEAIGDLENLMKKGAQNITQNELKRIELLARECQKWETQRLFKLKKRKQK